MDPQRRADDQSVAELASEIRNLIDDVEKLASTVNGLDARLEATYVRRDVYSAQQETRQANDRAAAASLAALEMKVNANDARITTGNRWGIGIAITIIGGPLIAWLLTRSSP